MKTVRSLFVKDWMVLNRQLLFMLIYIVVFVGIFTANDDSSGFLTGIFSALVVLLAINASLMTSRRTLTSCWPQHRPPRGRSCSPAISPACPSACWEPALLPACRRPYTRYAMSRSALPGTLTMAVASLGVGTLCAAVMFPLFYKFGVNKGRLVLILACAVPAAITGGISALVQNPDQPAAALTPVLLSGRCPGCWRCWLPWRLRFPLPAQCIL